MTYLWLRYPNKYYIYKYTYCKAAGKKLEYAPQFKVGSKDNIEKSIKLFDAINSFIKKDADLADILRKNIDQNCYPDSELKTVTADICYFIDKSQRKANDEKPSPEENEWFGLDYETGLGINDWIDLWNDKDVFTEASKEIVARFKDYGGEATYKQLAEKYGKDDAFYDLESIELGKRICQKRGIEPCNKPNAEYWPVLYLGKLLEDGSYCYKLRDELSEALDQIDLSSIHLYGKADDQNEKYDKDDFLAEVYISEESYDELCGLLDYKKNLILQGPPGVGKTFAARRLAYSIMGEKNDSRIEFIQFHQSYSYEDFIMGYKPNDDGFILKRGIFYEFCEKAKADPDSKYFFIIDEINRGNMSKIFGELLVAIECDKRGATHSIRLAYGNGEERFYIPENLYIIGMMNTADRSLAMIDYALRRRFSFFEMSPAFDSKGFMDYQDSLQSDYFNILIGKIRDLNAEIEKDPSLGKGFCIGHSYFCDLRQGNDLEKRLRMIIDFEVLPMLREYWFDDIEKARNWERKLNGKE